MYRSQALNDQGIVESTINIDEKPHYVFGRAAEVVDVPLSHEGSSREHAALVHHEDGRIYVIDLKSVGTGAMGWMTWSFRSGRAS